MNQQLIDRTRAEREAQGLPPTVEDPLAYRDLAVLFGFRTASSNRKQKAS